jgi:hypothetical protein
MHMESKIPNRHAYQIQTTSLGARLFPFVLHAACGDILSYPTKTFVALLYTFVRMLHTEAGQSGATSPARNQCLGCLPGTKTHIP